LVKLSELNPMDVNFKRKSKIYGNKKCFDLLWNEIVKLLFFPSKKTKLFIRDNCIFLKWSNVHFRFDWGFFSIFLSYNYLVVLKKNINLRFGIFAFQIFLRTVKLLKLS